MTLETVRRVRLLPTDYDIYLYLSISRYMDIDIGVDKDVYIYTHIDLPPPVSQDHLQGIVHSRRVRSNEPKAHLDLAPPVSQDLLESITKLNHWFPPRGQPELGVVAEQHLCV